MISEVMLDKVFKILLELDAVVDDVPYVKDERPMTTYKDAPALPLDGGQNMVTKIVQNGDELKEEDKELVQSEGEIQVKCAWCGADMGTKDSEGSEDGISHGMCPACKKKEYAKAGFDEDDEELKEIAFPAPVTYPPTSIFRDVTPEADEEYERELPHSLIGGIEIYGIKIVEQEDPGAPPGPYSEVSPTPQADAGAADAGMGGDPDPSETDMTSQEQFSDPGKVFELKKIFSRLLALENYLSTITDEEVLVLRDYVSKAIDLFRVVVNNLVSFKDKINDIIVLYYEFLEKIYEILKKHYKSKEKEK
jgi:hypothetical protein